MEKDALPQQWTKGRLWGELCSANKEFNNNINKMVLGLLHWSKESLGYVGIDLYVNGCTVKQDVSRIT